MGTTSMGTYTAKLTDGPLEGKTMRAEFLESGDPRPRIEIKAATGAKRYLYSRGDGVEFSSDDSADTRPSAVEYRFLEAIFD